MVLLFPLQRSKYPIFQYSLCRVVLMVIFSSSASMAATVLSVLALSSRFDGPRCADYVWNCVCLSVLALSSRFDGQSRRGKMMNEFLLSVLALSIKTTRQSEY